MLGLASLLTGTARDAVHTFGDCLYENLHPANAMWPVLP